MINKFNSYHLLAKMYAWKSVKYIIVKSIYLTNIKNHNLLIIVQKAGDIFLIFKLLVHKKYSNFKERKQAFYNSQ